MSLDVVNLDAKSTSVLNQSFLCVLHGGAYLQLQDITRHNTLRFSFLVDFASCTRSPHSLFSLAVRPKEHLLASVESCSYPTTQGFARLTLALGEKSFSTKIPCGSWVAVRFLITDASQGCSECGHTPPSSNSDSPPISSSAVAKFALHVAIGEASFLVSDNLPHNHFRESLLMGSRTLDKMAQPSLFRDVVAEVSSPLCIQCAMVMTAALKSWVVEPGFSASLPLRCSPLCLAGNCWQLPQSFSPYNGQTC